MLERTWLVKIVNISKGKARKLDALGWPTEYDSENKVATISVIKEGQIYELEKNLSEIKANKTRVFFMKEN